MGLLDHLWDDTVAGPPPDSGLGKLRKYSSSSSSSTAGAAAASSDVAAAGGLQITRCIAVLRTATFSTSSSAASSPRSPSSPGPDSPLASPTPRGYWKSLRRKPMPAAAAEGMETAEPSYPTVYDWVVISSLDR